MINPDLSKLQCPECGSTGNFEVAIVCNSEVSEDGFPDIQLESWHVQPRGCCDCMECGHEGSIGEFLGETPEEPAAKPAPWVAVYQSRFGDTVPFLFDHEPSIDEVIEEIPRDFTEFDDERESITIAEGCFAQGATTAPADNERPQEKLICPECGAEEAYVVGSSVGVAEAGEIDSNSEPAEYEKDSGCMCGACDYKGTVAEFRHTASPSDEVPPPEEAPELYVGLSEDGDVIGEWDERLRSAGCRAVLKSSL